MPWQMTEEDVRIMRACEDADYDADEDACEEYAWALAQYALCQES
jgi:hypothetical protein